MAENQKNADNPQVLKSKIAQLEKLLLTAKTSLQEHQRVNKAKDATIETLTGKVANIERERREERIASILQGAYKDEEIKSHTESFAKSGMDFESIEKVVAPLKVANRIAAEQEQVKAQEAKVEEKAKEIAKSAKTTTQHESKVAIKNASLETPVVSEIPAFIRTRQHLLGGNA